MCTEKKVTALPFSRLQSLLHEYNFSLVKLKNSDKVIKDLYRMGAAFQNGNFHAEIQPQVLDKFIFREVHACNSVSNSPNYASILSKGA